MTDGDALLRAVCDRPDDDLVRLVYADWLDEHGDPARAEFIRVQCEIARFAQAGSAADGRDPPPALVAREAELLAACSEEWSRPLRKVGYGDSDFHVDRVTFRRGFAWGLVVTDEEDEFRDYAKQLFRLAPVERIAFLLTYSHENRAKCKELRRLRELGVDRCGYEPEVVAQLLASKHLGNLVRLEMTADDDNNHLERLSLELLGDCPNLPALRGLDLSGNWCCWLDDPDDVWVRHLLAGRLVAQLTRLSLGNTFFCDDDAELLAGSDRVRNLVRLDVPGNSLTGRGLLALARSPHLASLRTLDLRGNSADDPESDAAGRAALVARFGAGVLLGD